MIAAPKRTIERVPAAFVAILADQGKLTLPPQPDADGFGFRKPTLADLAKLEWHVAWDGFHFDPAGGLRHASGAVAHYDHFDFHSSSEVREICVLTGSARAIVTLIRFLRCSARADGKRLTGYVDAKHWPLIKTIARIGGTVTRIYLEDR